MEWIDRERERESPDPIAFEEIFGIIIITFIFSIIFGLPTAHQLFALK